MDIESYRNEMKSKIRKARDDIEKKHSEINLQVNHVRYLSRAKNDALRDSLNEIDKKLDRFYELDNDLWFMLREDIDDLWKRVKLLLDI